MKFNNYGDYYVIVITSQFSKTVGLLITIYYLSIAMYHSSFKTNRCMELDELYAIVLERL